MRAAACAQPGKVDRHAPCNKTAVSADVCCSLDYAHLEVAHRRAELQSQSWQRQQDVHLKDAAGCRLAARQLLIPCLSCLPKLLCCRCLSPQCPVLPPDTWVCNPLQQVLDRACQHLKGMRTPPLLSVHSDGQIDRRPCRHCTMKLLCTSNAHSGSGTVALRSVPPVWAGCWAAGLQLPAGTNLLQRVADHVV